MAVSQGLPPRPAAGLVGDLHGEIEIPGRMMRRPAPLAPQAERRPGPDPRGDGDEQFVPPILALHCEPLPATGTGLAPREPELEGQVAFPRCGGQGRPTRAEQDPSYLGETPDESARALRLDAPPGVLGGGLVALERRLRSAHDGAREPQKSHRRGERSADKHGTGHHRTPSEESLPEDVRIDAHPHAVELAHKVVEHVAGARVGEEIAEDVLAPVAKATRDANLAGPIVLAALV